MNNVFKKIVFLVIGSVVAAIVIGAVFFTGELSHAKEIEDPDFLTGQRIGVVCAYEGDYVLSDRDDITLCRYDSEADVIVALCYKQIDAFATVVEAAQYIMNECQGFKINEKPIDGNGMASLFGEGDPLMDEFGDFLDIYMKTDEYQEYLDCVENQEYYDGSAITEETGTGKTLRIGYAIDYIPVSFFDTINKCPNGSEVDIWRRFANYMNYQIEWVKTSELSGFSDVALGNIDVFLDGYSDVYRGECEKSPYCDMGPVYRESKIVLLEVEDYDKIVIGNIGEGEE